MIRIGTFLLICLALLSGPAMAGLDSDVKALFEKHEKIIHLHQTELIEQVFSKRYIQDKGGLKDFEASIKEKPKADEKKLKDMSVSWKKGAVTDRILARREEMKNGKKDKGHTEYIVIKKDGKLIIDDTIGDAD